MPSSIITCELLDDGQVSVDMGAPIFPPADVPFVADQYAPVYQLDLPDGKSVEVSVLSVGNPHAVLPVDDVDTADVAGLGPLIEAHPDFPERANAGFMQIVSAEKIRLRVFERGVGETLACGTGACAAVVYGIQRGWLQDTVTVELPGGKLTIAWAGAGQPVVMTGPTAVVFEGSIRI